MAQPHPEVVCTVPILHVVELLCRGLPDQPVAIIWSEHGLLAECVRLFCHLFNHRKLEFDDLWLEPRQVIDTSCIFGRDFVALGEISLHYGNTLYMRHHLCRICVQVLALLFCHDTLV